MNVFECPFSFHARKQPKQIALSLENQNYTYTECNQIIETFCRRLKKEGVKEGDRVAFFPMHDSTTPLLFFSLFRLKAIACPLNTYLPEAQLTKALDALNAAYFFFPSNLADSLPPLKQITFPISALLMKELKTSSENVHFLDKESYATYLFTSGSSKTPKIACHSLGNHYYSALGSNAYLPIKPGDRWLLSLPLYHVAGIGILFRTFLAGGCVVLSYGKPHDPETLILSKATHLSFVPTQLYRLLETASLEELFKLGAQIKGILLGGAAISPSLYRLGWLKGLPIFPTYGMTEMSSQITTQFESSYFSLGHPLPYREMAISQNHEILVKGKTLFQGYLNASNTLDLPKNEGGWFATGDIGSYSPKKGLSVKGRKDRLFISGGENIYPEEIEEKLKQIEGIIEVRVEPIEDLEFGKRPVAYIHSEKPFQEEMLKEYLSHFLPRYKVPVAFHSRTLKSKLLD